LNYGCMSIGLRKSTYYLPVEQKVERNI